MPKPKTPDQKNGQPRKPRKTEAQLFQALLDAVDAYARVAHCRVRVRISPQKSLGSDIPALDAVYDVIDFRGKGRV